MASEEASSNEAAQKPAADPPSNETIAAALEEALQNARLLRVSSSIFLKEAMELLDSGRAAALLWAADCLEGLNEVEKERLAGVKEATATNSVPLVPVQSKKQLAEWVGLGKIGRLRRNAACLLAVVLHSADGADTDEAPALSKLLENYPQAPKPSPKPISTQRVSSAGSKVTTPKTAKAHSRHSYTPDAVSFRSAFTGKDTLPVLKRTSSSTPGSRRESADGAASLPSWALSRRESLAASEASEQAPPAPSKAASSPAAGLEKTPEPSKAVGTAAPAAVSSPSKAAPAAAGEAASSKPETAPAGEAAKEIEANPKGKVSPEKKAAPVTGKAASAPVPAVSKAPEAGPVSKEEPAVSSTQTAVSTPAAPVRAAAPEKSQKVAENTGVEPLVTSASACKSNASPEPRPAAKKSPRKQQKEPAAAVANGKSSPAKAAAAKPGAPEIWPAGPAEPGEAPGKTSKQEAAALVTAAPDVATPAAKPAPTSDAFTPGAGLPGTANSSAAAQATPSEAALLAGRSGSVARPEEVSAFRMARRKRTSSNAAAMPPPNAAAASDEAADGAAENGSVTAMTADEVN